MNNFPKTMAELQSYQVSRQGQFEAVRQSIYDSATYTSASTTSISFFQTPIGQSSKTIADTNMKLAGQMPAQQYFLLQSIELLIFPGVLPGTYVTTGAETEFANDMYTFAKSGSLTLNVLSKAYLQEAPIGRFPPKSKLDGWAAYAYNAEVSEDLIRMDYATFAGRPYFVEPNLLLQPNQNFDVTLAWPTALTLPSGTAARIVCIMDGITYRASQ